MSPDGCYFIIWGKHPDINLHHDLYSNATILLMHVSNSAHTVQDYVILSKASFSKFYLNSNIKFVSKYSLSQSKSPVVTCQSDYMWCFYEFVSVRLPISAEIFRLTLTNS